MATLLDGKKCAEKLREDLKAAIASRKSPPTLGAIVVGIDAVTEKFVAQKEKMAHLLGVRFRTYRYDVEISTSALRKRIATIVHEGHLDGLIIQLPLPPSINRQNILNAVPPELDVDMLSARSVGDFEVGKARTVPPVVGAIKTLFETYGIAVSGKHAVVLGAGDLVGRPAATWLRQAGATVSVVRSTTPNISEFTERADIIISGVGKPGLIIGAMVKEGAVIVDAGTSESSGKIVGDVDFDSVSKKASFVTPVPGGVGPLTVVMIFKNLLTLSQ